MRQLRRLLAVVKSLPWAKAALPLLYFRATGVVFYLKRNPSRISFFTIVLTEYRQRASLARQPAQLIRKTYRMEETCVLLGLVIVLPFLHAPALPHTPLHFLQQPASNNNYITCHQFGFEVLERFIAIFLGQIFFRRNSLFQSYLPFTLFSLLFSDFVHVWKCRNDDGKTEYSAKCFSLVIFLRIRSSSLRFVGHYYQRLMCYNSRNTMPTKRMKWKWERWRCRKGRILVSHNWSPSNWERVRIIGYIWLWLQSRTKLIGETG